MLSRIKLLSPVLALSIFAIAGATTFAQQPQNPNPGQSNGDKGSQRPWGPGEARGFRRGPGRGGAFGPGVLRELNLTDDQRQQIRTIMGASFESTKAQREELRKLGEKRFQGTLTADDQARLKTLHEQLQASMKDTESKVAAVLTAEQKAKLEELRKQRQANHERFGRRRGGFPGRPDGGGPPPQKPANPPLQP